MDYTLLIMALLGMLLNVFKKYDSGLKLARAGNAKFNPSIYLQKDWLSIAVALIAVIVAVYNTQEIKAVLPEKYQGILKMLFLGVGYFGSDVLIYLLNKSRKLTLNLIDKNADRLSYDVDKKPVGTKEEI